MAMKVVLILQALAVSCYAQYDYGYNPRKYTQEVTPIIQLAQGQLRGVVVDTSCCGSCQQYLGIPYAAAPRGALRFMPPRSAPSWRPGLLQADTHGPVCPQKLPEMKNMIEERKEKFKRLLQHLTNQSEDCLNLNIYTPRQDPLKQATPKYPVIIYIHGQTHGGNYEWNSGNPYDGCVLSSYGKVVFITINYRLGILGFLKTGVGDKAHTNLGLKDQVAALLWVQENIAAFGGNPGLVTLMGHGTGAACVNFLMMSPMLVREGSELFHRAILMSGSALTDWALVTNSLQLTLQVAQTLNCPSGDDELANCLRRKRLEEIMRVPVETPRFVTKFGPVVDGLVVPNFPEKLMSKYNNLFKQYDMMFGLTEIESDNLLDGVQLTHGLFEPERSDILRKYLQARYEYHPDMALDSTLRTYANLSLTSNKYYRDTVLAVLSDARVAAPVIQTGNYHSKVNPKSYFYVFGHSTISKDYLDIHDQIYKYNLERTPARFLREKSLHGEELQYVFGAPLGGAKDLFTGFYTEKEKILSEIIMTFWINFAYSGNPMATDESEVKPAWTENWPEDWPEYSSTTQPFMLLAIPPKVQYKYREPLMKYWNDILPDKLNNSSGRTPIPYIPPPNPRPYYTPTTPPKYPIFLRTTSTEPPAYVWRPPLFHTTPPTFGKVREYPNFLRPEKNIQGTKSLDNDRNIDVEPTQESASATINVLIIIGALFLLVNVLTFAGLYYKRKRLRDAEMSLKRQYEDTNMLPPITDVSPEKKPKIDDPIEPATLQRGCNVMKMIRHSTKSEDTYEAVVKQSEESDSNSRFKLTRQISASTIDPHTKVRDWIAHEIVQRCSPRFLRKTRQQFALEHKLSQEKDNKKTTKPSDTINKNTTSSTNHLTKQSSTTSTPKTGSKNVSSKSGIPTSKPQKVSVAIDATPGARGSSVLKQQPIELSKSMDLYSKEPETKPLRRSVTMDDFLTTKLEDEPILRKSSTNINLKKQNAIDDEAPISVKYIPPNSDVIKIHHQHSRSDPVQMISGDLNDIQQDTIKLRTFDVNQDVNVTSRDDIDNLGPILSPEEALQTIKRRNFPKVLPDLPNQQINAMKRRSLPMNNLFMLPESKKMQAHSSNTLKNFSRVPPAPPPRTSSTLGRKPSIPFYHPAPVFAEEPPQPEEPQITSNTLHVGPIIPVRQPREVLSSERFKLNTQPIYDNLRTSDDKKTAVELKKAVAKTIITTDPDQPVKKVEQPKVIIKPSVPKKLNDPTKINKVIPRVVAKDFNVESEAKIAESGKPVVPKNKPSHIPTFCKTKSSSPSSSDSSSTCEGSDTGTVVKRE